MKYNTVLPIQEQRIRFANVTIYIRKDGRIIVRQRYNDTGKDIRTPERLENMVRWANTLNQYRAMADLLRSLFNDRKAFRTACNDFISLNFRNAKVCLTKRESSLGACVFEPSLIVSFGNTEKVPPIEVTLTETQLVSNIRVDDDFAITDQTTIAEFTNQVVRRNPTLFNDGDTLFFLRATQGFNDQLELPVGEKTWYRCELDPKDSRKLKEVVGTDGFLSAMVDGKRLLVAPADADSLGTWIHGRKVRGRFYSSVQYLVGRNSLLPNYTSLEAKKKAMLSYGGANEVNVLNPNTTVITWEEVNNGGTGTSSGTGGQGGNQGNSDPTQVTLTSSVVGSGGTVSPSETTVEVGTQVTFTARPNSGKRVKIWSTGATSNTITVTATTNQAYTVEFETDPNYNSGGDL